MMSAVSSFPGGWKGEGSASGIQKLLGGKQNDFGICAARLLEILSITEDETAFRVGAKPLHRTFRKRGSQRHNNTADTQDAEQGEDPVRDVLHENTHAVTPANASRFETGGDAIREPKNVGVGKFLKAIGVVENECGAVRSPFCPLFDAIEDPTSGNRRISRWA